jgi:UPF0755 protein
VIAYRAVAAAVAIGALLLTAALAWFVLQTPGAIFQEESERAVAAVPTSGTPVVVTVARGESAKTIGQELQRDGIIRDERLFEIMVSLRGVTNSLEAGDYEFDHGLPVVEVVDRIAHGKTASRQVTIVEGSRAEEIGDALERAGIVSKQDFMAALVKGRYNEPFLAQVTSSGLEGYLFPARYEFRRDASAADVVDRMLAGFQANVADTVQLEGQSLSLGEVITLASIVQREAGTLSEMPTIASVFLNRLRLGIPLQADPTVQFAIAQDGPISTDDGYWKKELSVDDLKIDSGYNTYVNAGLPPGPIANPGLDAINAVIRPATTNYLYFVAKGDGTHAFAETLEEHERNIAQYQAP